MTAGSSIRPNRRSAMMRMQNVQTLLAATLRETDIAVTHLRCGHANHGLTDPYELEDSFLLTVQLNAFEFGLTRSGRWLPDCAWRTGTVGIYEMQARWLADMRTPFDVMHFHIPRSALNRLAEELETPVIAGLRCPAYAGAHDPVLYGLALALLPSLERPDEAHKLFVDHTRFVLCSYLAQRYGGISLGQHTQRGGLSPRQLRCATELISANLGGSLTIGDLARECGVSAGHFVRAFRKTTGLPPHRWLTHRRIDKAKGLLRATSLPLAEIATICGFVDQSHFTRVFSGITGTTPSSWRRNRLQ